MTSTSPVINLSIKNSLKAARLCACCLLQKAMTSFRHLYHLSLWNLHANNSNLLNWTGCDGASVALAQCDAEMEDMTQVLQHVRLEQDGKISG